MPNNAGSAESTSPFEESDTISQIFDKLLKRILSLSKGAVIDLVNGMFDEDFPPDSETTFNSTENVNSRLRRTVADIIITLRSKDKCRRFHMEAQISNDNTIVLRVFEYGFHDALRHQEVDGNKITLPFPEPLIIFLEHTRNTPDEVILELDFGKHGKFEYPVATMKFLDYSVAELCDRRMVILLPLYLLRLRREIESAKAKKTVREKAKDLQSLISDILKAIADNEKIGNITNKDTVELLHMMSHLYEYLYGSIKEFDEEEVSAVLAGALELPCDARFEAEQKEVKKQIAKNLKLKGVLSFDEIAETTGLSFEEVEKA